MAALAQSRHPLTGAKRKMKKKRLKVFIIIMRIITLDTRWWSAQRQLRVPVSFSLSFSLYNMIYKWYHDFRYETIDCTDQRENDQIKYRKISRRVFSTMVGVFVKILRNTLWVQVITALFLFVSYLSFFLSPFSPFIFISFVNRHCALWLIFLNFFFIFERGGKRYHTTMSSQ